MAKIDIRNASVSYFLRKQHGAKNLAGTGKIGAQILVGKVFLEIAALKNITLTLQDGDRVGLIGANGSGKSTLLKLCAGALTVQRGSIEIEGKVSPQFSLGSGTRSSLSGRRNAELKCLYMGIPQGAIASYVEEAKQLSGLGEYFELPMRSYSAGMKSRFVMSLMRMVRGNIFVMDEWIGAADASVNETVNALQVDMMKSAAILVMASHSKSVLADWTNRAVWLNQGEIAAIGSVEEVHAAYTDWLKANKGK